MAEDPEFTQGDYQVVRAQMLALRSLCYFYLVRAFRDVPYTTHSYENDSEVEVLEQSAPDVVLQQLSGRPEGGSPVHHAKRRLRTI